MPCVGPPMPTDEEINVVFDDVLSYIREKHSLLKMQEDYLREPFKFNRMRALHRLRESIKDVMSQTACEEF